MCQHYTQTLKGRHFTRYLLNTFYEQDPEPFLVGGMELNKHMGSAHHWLTIFLQKWINQK